MNLEQDFKVEGQHAKIKRIYTYKQRIGKWNLKKYQLKLQQQKTYGPIQSKIFKTSTLRIAKYY